MRSGAISAMGGVGEEDGKKALIYIYIYDYAKELVFFLYNGCVLIFDDDELTFV